MYIRKSTRRYKDKTYTNYVLVESLHTEKGPRQKAVCSLGDLGPRPREAWLKLAHKIETALIGQGDLLEPHPDPEVAEIVAKVRARARVARPPRAAEAVDASRVTTERHRDRFTSAISSGNAWGSMESSRASVSSPPPGVSPVSWS